MKEGGPVLHTSPEQDVAEQQFAQDKYGNQVVTFRGMTGTITELAEKGCPIDLTNVGPEKIERYTINIMNSSGAEINPEDEQKFRSVLEAQGKEFNVTVRQESLSVESEVKRESIADKKKQDFSEKFTDKSKENSSQATVQAQTENLTKQQKPERRAVVELTIDASSSRPKQVAELPLQQEDKRVNKEPDTPMTQAERYTVEEYAVVNQILPEHEIKQERVATAEVLEKHIEPKMDFIAEIQAQEEDGNEEYSIDIEDDANHIDTEDVADELSSLWHELDEQDTESMNKLVGIDEDEQAAMELRATADYLAEEDIVLTSEVLEPEGTNEQTRTHERMPQSLSQDLEQAVVAFEADASPEEAEAVEKLYQELTQIAEFIAEIRAGQPAEQLVPELTTSERDGTDEAVELIEHPALQGITEEQLIGRLEVVCERLLDKLDIPHDAELIQLMVAELLKPQEANEQDLDISKLSAEEREKLGMRNFKYGLTFTQLNADLAALQAALHAKLGTAALKQSSLELAA